MAEMGASVVIWLIIAVVFGIAEAMTVALISIWMAVGALAAALVSALGGSFLLQIIVFLTVSALLLLLTIPMAKKLRNRKMVRTNADRFIGEEAVVLVPIEPIENQGQIKVLGQIWSASSVDSSTIAVGEKVVVEGIEGVRAIVRPLPENGDQEC